MVDFVDEKSPASVWGEREDVGHLESLVCDGLAVMLLGTDRYIEAEALIRRLHALAEAEPEPMQRFDKQVRQNHRQF